MRYFVTLAGRTFEVDLDADGVTVDGRPAQADLARVDGTNIRSLLLDGVSHRMVMNRAGSGTWDIHTGGRRYATEAIDERTRTIRGMTGAAASAAGPKPVRAPMPGLVVKVEVVPGDRVEAGQGLIIVEAMKMENELKAEGPAVVRHIHVEPGQAVEKDQILIDLAAPDETDGTESAGEDAS